MSDHPAFPAALFDQAGLNRQHIFALDSLPPEVKKTLGDTGDFGQLILLGHGGKRLWACVQAANIAGEHPIDRYVVETVEQIFTAQLPGHSYRLLYPGDAPVGLQQLGTLAGWHHPSPFMVGVDAEWGSWFAYRAVILANTDFLPFLAVDRSNPCDRCQARPCLGHCPAGALAQAGEEFSLTKCISYRKQPDSACRHTCQARLSCPVGAEHRYDTDQLRHSYALSLRMIEEYFCPPLAHKERT